MFQITYSKKAEKVWNLIQASFILSDVEEIEPDPEELEALRRYIQAQTELKKAPRLPQQTIILPEKQQPQKMLQFSVVKPEQQK